jgi:hypothetical protein
MKTIIIITAMLLTVAAQAQTSTTRCWKNADGSMTCVTTRGNAGF